MPKITVLNQETIDQIAAGEVIDRPSSVVKELMENSIDAGATAVTVEIRDGGISFIRITDNGCGIERDQIPTAFLRHATSKIRSAADLLTVSSLGFRGEALSSIAAVSQVEIITKTAAELTGSRYQIHGGKEVSMEEIGAPEGTTFLVRNLFYNTPARKKFLKTPQTGALQAGYFHPFYPERPDQAPHFRKPQSEGPDLYGVREGDRRQSAAHPGGDGAYADIRLSGEACDLQREQDL